jgi:hypothetical protein
VSGSVLDLSEVLGNFQTPDPVTAFEITGARNEDGTWDGWASSPRTIQAVVLQAKLQELEILAPGEVSDGGIMVHTDETLFYQNAKNSGMETRQSFITYQDMTFRVIGTGFMKPLGNFNTYYAVMYQGYGVEALTTTTTEGVQ